MNYYNQLESMINKCEKCTQNRFVALKEQLGLQDYSLIYDICKTTLVCLEENNDFSIDDALDYAERMWL